MKRILFATGNPHKVEEVNVILRSCGYQAVPTSTAKLEIQSDSLEEIAAVAATVAYANLGEPVMVEDAGLFIKALKGFPGPYSSYVYKTIGINGVLKLLEGVNVRDAVFVSVIAVAYKGGVKLFSASVEGFITESPRGSGGFGFDPIFVPKGSTRTFAEMSVEEKSLLSHRGRAARKLCEWLKYGGLEE